MLLRRALLVGSLVLLSQPAAALTLTPTTDGAVLANSIIGPGVTVIGVPTYVGAPDQSATFVGGVASGVGFESGIVLTTGNATELPGANLAPVETRGLGDGEPDLDTDLGLAGDTNLSALAGFPTFDAAVVQFNFQFGDGTGGGNNLFVNFVFGSEEYIDYVDTPYNDVFAFYVDGVNIALAPGGGPVTVNNINDVANAANYRNNVDNSNGIANLGLDNKFDGLTTVLTASALGLGPGVHTMKFAIADTSDGILDAGVFIQGGAFSTTPIPEPSLLVAQALALCVLGLRKLALA